MVVVSDTSPVSAMAKLDWLEWLRQRWQVVILPQEVWDELE
jgi:predicted nucleic acid-binding protein